jgi:hypothetical protein
MGVFGQAPDLMGWGPAACSGLGGAALEPGLAQKRSELRGEFGPGRGRLAAFSSCRFYEVGAEEGEASLTLFCHAACFGLACFGQVKSWWWQLRARAMRTADTRDTCR